MNSYPNKEEAFVSKSFIDYDKMHQDFYYNLYLNKEKFVVKIPLKKRPKRRERIKLKKFDLTKYTCLLCCDF